MRSTDDDGNQIRTTCLYEVSGPMPAARRWSMSVTGADGVAATLGAGEAVYEPDGSLRVYLSSQPVPGNRLTLPPGGTPVKACHCGLRKSQ